MPLCRRGSIFFGIGIGGVTRFFRETDTTGAHVSGPQIRHTPPEKFTKLHGDVAFWHHLLTQALDFTSQTPRILPRLKSARWKCVVIGNS